MRGGITGLNHVTFAVADLDRALGFYRDVLGCALRARWPGGAYLEAGPLWLCLLVGPVTARGDYSHVAFGADEADFERLRARIRAACTLWQPNTSEGASVYMLDPDGHRLELHVGTLASRLEHLRGRGRADVAFHDAPPPPALVSGTAASAALAASWDANAERWTDAVRSGAIASRRLVTDRAAVRAVLRGRPRRVLDLGCGEGWLARALAPHVEGVVGVDSAPALVARAREAGGAEFHHARFADLVAEPGRFGHGFDAVVANFALLDDGLAPLLSALALATQPGGLLVVQTLHPATAAPPYRDGWREESFASFGEGWAPMPWYFRTAGSWLREIGRHWRIRRVEEPLHPVTAAPASLLISATKPRARRGEPNAARVS